MKRKDSTSTPTAGRKPSVAFVTEEIAKENIRIKIELLERVISRCEKDGSALKRAQDLVMVEGVIHIPNSLRQFYSWCDAKALCDLTDEVAPSITKIGNGTLSRHLELKVRAERALAAIYQMQTLAHSSKGSEDIKRPARELKESRRQVDVLERELLAMRIEMNALIRERDDTKRLYENLKRRFHEELAMALRQGGDVHDAKISRLRKPLDKP